MQEILDIFLEKSKHHHSNISKSNSIGKSFSSPYRLALIDCDESGKYCSYGYAISNGFFMDAYVCKAYKKKCTY